MKKLIIYLGVLLLSSSIVTSCKKREKEIALDEETKQFNEDANEI
jgi:hypothetical protein